MKKIAIFLADGFEEIEGIVPFDIFVRAGIDVDLYSINNSHEIIGTHNVKIVANKIFDDNFVLDSYDAIVFPGGLPGASNLSQNAKLVEIVKKQFKRDKIVAAICASPAFILKDAGILNKKYATSYPGMGENINAIYKENDVVIDKNIVTSRGPATAFEFAYTIVEMLGYDTKQLRKCMLYNFPRDIFKNKN